MEIGKINDLIGKDLSYFKIEEIVEVYGVDEDGLNPNSIGCFRNPTIASAFAGPQNSSNQIKTRKRLVLSDGITAYGLNSIEIKKFFNDEEEALRLKNEALEKLSPEQRTLLGLG
jgi:hypothetical protein